LENVGPVFRESDTMYFEHIKVLKNGPECSYLH